MELALVLAEGTGRRLGSFRQLRWDDFDFEHGRIRWRAEADKKRRESVVPYPSALMDECRAFQKQLGALGGWLFPRESDGTQPMDRHLFDKWLTVAERHAELRKLDGGLWHPYRRKWATERKQYSVKDVAEAGGWKDYDTLLTCYQHADAETLLAVSSRGSPSTLPSGRNGNRNGNGRRETKRPSELTGCSLDLSEVGTAGFEPATP
jgi:integrase